jgi:hypothetical protein
VYLVVRLLLEILLGGSSGRKQQGAGHQPSYPLKR